MTQAHNTRSFLAALAAYGASEVAAKASRLCVVFAVARTLDLTTIGVAAAALAAGDMLKALTENGVGQRIIAARDADLQATCNRAHQLFWIWCGGLFLAQVAIAAGLYLAGADPVLASLLALMGLEYLFMPAGLVQVALAMRSGKLRQTAAIAGAQNVGANGLSILLLIFWPTAFALVVPRVISAPIWLIAVRRLHPWRRSRTHASPVAPFLRYGWAVLGVEVVKVARLQADKLIVGASLGAETLGLYFMAFNAGLSLSNAFSSAFSIVLFPRLARATNRVDATRQGLMIGMACITPLVFLQALLAPYYVPLLLGDGWDGVERFVQILCLLAIPTTLWSAAASWLRNQNHADVEFAITALLTASVIANAVLIGPLGLAPLVTGYAVLTATIMSLSAGHVLRPVLFPNTSRSVTP